MMHTIISTSKSTLTLGLTHDELEILHMLAFDYTIEEMQLELGQSIDEIEKLEKSLYIKMGVETMTGLMRMAYESGVLVLIKTL